MYAREDRLQIFLLPLVWKAFRWALTCKTTLVKHWSQSSCQQQRYCFDVGTDGSCRSDSVTEWIYVEALIGKLHLAFLEQWPEMLEQTTTNCWPKPVVEGVVEDDWNLGNERRKTWACCWVFKEKVDSWDVPERKTTVPNKTHKLNTFPLLRKEYHRHFSFSLDMWFTTLSGSEWLSQTRAFWGDNHGVLFVFADYIILHLKQSLVCSSISSCLLDFCHRCWVRGHICFHEAVKQILFCNIVVLDRI